MTKMFILTLQWFMGYIFTGTPTVNILLMIWNLDRGKIKFC